MFRSDSQGIGLGLEIMDLDLEFINLSTAVKNQGSE